MQYSPHAMNVDGIWANIFRIRQQKDSLIETLRQVPLFKDLNTKELNILEGLVHRRSYKPGEAVFVESEPGSGVYIVQSGHVDVVLKHQTDMPIILAELKAGDFFGEMALLGDSARSASAISRDHSELIGFFHPDLEEILNLRPSMGAKITLGLAKTLSDRLRYTNEQLRDVWGIRDEREHGH